MYINGIGFLTTVDQPIIYRSCVPMALKNHSDYYREIDKILRIYNNSNITIQTIECDKEFEDMMDEVNDKLDINMNYANTDDHVSAAERNN